MAPLRELGRLLATYWMWWLVPLGLLLVLLVVLALMTSSADSTFNYSPLR